MSTKTGLDERNDWGNLRKRSEDQWTRSPLVNLMRDGFYGTIEVGFRVLLLYLGDDKVLLRTSQVSTIWLLLLYLDHLTRNASTNRVMDRIPSPAQRRRTWRRSDCWCRSDR
jgi:hypothetical protein